MSGAKEATPKKQPKLSLDQGGPTRPDQTRRAQSQPKTTAQATNKPKKEKREKSAHKAPEQHQRKGTPFRRKKPERKHSCFARCWKTKHQSTQNDPQNARVDFKWSINLDRKCKQVNIAKREGVFLEKEPPPNTSPTENLDRK